MGTDLINKVLRFGEGRTMKQRFARVARIGALEPRMQDLSDQGLRDLADELRGRVAEGASLDSVLEETFALVRETGWRTMGMRHYDVQLVGAMVLHEGKVSEMKTGEGKTLAATPAVVLNSLTGRGVHVVTVNDYLARRDAQWMSPIYDALGVSIGVIEAMMPEDQRRAAYAADVTHGTNSEFGFDYLRDNMASRLEDCVQRGHYFGIVDEVDSILIDEARTPLIISGIPEQAADTYYRFARIVPTLRKGTDFEVDEKHRTAAPTESGVAKIEKALGIDNLYLDVNGQLVNHLIQALKAHSLFRKDKEYIVRDGEVLIVDEFTGRVLEGRRYSEGLHQAIEAKEGLKIREENQTLATITLQNYFRMYEKLSGMTGTASTEANEFSKIYKMDVVTVPTHRPMVRKDENDQIFKTKDAKFSSVVEDIVSAHERGQPVLVGTISVEISEMLSGLLTKRGVPHSVLNAKQHEQEAQIIKDAGERGAVTIATNMAGRGVDIKLGDGVPELGGLYVIGTERHESRRIDNQLRGRSGRQGDPGQSRFYLSAEDDLIRIFSGDRMYRILDRLGPGDDLPIEAKILTKTVEGAQKKVEEYNFNIRKRVLEYDDVLNKQREVIYAERRQVLEGEDLSDRARDWVVEALVDIVDEFADEEQSPADWDLEGIFASVGQIYPISFGPDDVRHDGLTREELLDRLEDDAMDAYARREQELGTELMRDLERWVVLQIIDVNWREHLLNMDYLREGIHLRALGQKDPLSEYRLEGHSMFDEMMDIVRREFVRYMFHVEVEAPPQPAAAPQPAQLGYSYADEPVQGFSGLAVGSGEPDQIAAEPVEDRGGVAVVEQRLVPEEERIGRNDPCPCGSGKKYKKCHGA
ncbi:MAG: preprotein translocase subunit SecA [Thermoleophilia bacterium]|jgi:preprotein translocase subunit SecA|nr:preprotein translocase subunit SecA [Thermoleophilia bacterium]